MASVPLEGQKEMSTLAVVEEILRETEVPMSVKEIVQRAGDRLPTKSKTPDTVVARDLSMDIKKKGESSMFIRTAPGRYTMRAIWERKQREEAEAQAHGDEATSITSSAMRSERAGTKPARPTSADSSSESSAPAG